MKRIIILHGHSEVSEMYKKHFVRNGLEVSATFQSFSDIVDYFIAANKSLDRRVELDNSIVLIPGTIGDVDILDAARTLKGINSSTRLMLATSDSEVQVEYCKDAFDSVIRKPFLISELLRAIDDILLESKNNEMIERESEIDFLESRTGVIFGLVNTTKFFLATINNAKQNFGAVVEAGGAQLFSIDDYKNAVQSLNERKIISRVIMEITPENYEVSKEISAALELRHLNSVRGSFCITDSCYMSSTEPLDKVELVPKLFYSSLESVVSQHQFVFEQLWKEAIPASLRFKEIEAVGLPREIAKSTNLA
jgi:DNA-binding response OmpR family regulator